MMLQAENDQSLLEVHHPRLQHYPGEEGQGCEIESEGHVMKVCVIEIWVCVTAH